MAATSLVYLAGMPGSGKTATGKILAGMLGFTFIDLDTHLEQKLGTTIKELFATKGEEFFRLREHEALLQTISMHGTVVSTGGGVPAHYNNMGLMKANGITVFLDTSVSELARRIGNSATKRPLLAAGTYDEVAARLQVLWQQRQAFYRQSHITITTNSKTSVEVANEIALALATYLQQ